jgi:hypothetical protein
VRVLRELLDMQNDEYSTYCEGSSSYILIYLFVICALLLRYVASKAINLNVAKNPPILSDLKCASCFR